MRPVGAKHDALGADHRNKILQRTGIVSNAVVINMAQIVGRFAFPECQERIELRRKYRQVQMERDILAKACGPSLPTAPTRRLPRLRAELFDDGVVASRKRIARLMRQGQMRGVKKGKTNKRKSKEG